MHLLRTSRFPSLAESNPYRELGKREIRRVEVTSLASPWKGFVESMPPGARQPRYPALLQRTFTGALAAELIAQWDAQPLSCHSLDGAPEQFNLCFFSPSFQLRFFDEKGGALVAALCWSCGIALIQSGTTNHWCEFNPSKAALLKQQLVAAMPLLLGTAEWANLMTRDENSDSAGSAFPISFGRITGTRPGAAKDEPMQLGDLGSSLDLRRLAHCYDRHWLEHPQARGELVFEFELAQYPFAVPPSRGTFLTDDAPKLPLQDLELVRSTIEEPTLTECVTAELRRWRIRPFGLLIHAPLHVRLPIEFRPLPSLRASAPSN